MGRPRGAPFGVAYSGAVSNGIRYIVLSDVHLGASNSILTEVDPQTGAVDPEHAGPALVALVDCLHALVAGAAGAAAPVLVADGDVIDLALSPPEAAAPVFGQFLARMLAPGRPAIDHEVLLLPGNHDHIVWEYTREHWFEDHLVDAVSGAVDTPAVRRRIGPMWLDEKPRFDAPLLPLLVHRLTMLDDLRVRVLYPDLALASADGRRAVLVTHGHYIESVSKVMSGFLRMVVPQAPAPRDVETMEEENWPWLDFFFSSMTRSGRPGALIESIYDVLQNEQALGRLIDTIAHNLTAKRGLVVGRAERMGIRYGIGSLLDIAASSRERGITGEVLTDGTRQGLADYLVSLARRLGERGSALPADVSLVLGHTHKPFSEWWKDASWPGGGLRVFNTGGWVVDHATAQPLMGGAVALVSDELDVALVRLYQQIDDPAGWRISVETVEPGPGGEAFAARLRAVVDDDGAPFAAFTRVAAARVGERRAALARILSSRIEQLGGESATD